MIPSDPTSLHADPIIVARLGRCYGVRGWLHLQSFTDPAENVIAYQPWLIRPRQITPQSSRQHVTIAWQQLADCEVKRHGEGWIVKLPGVDNREQAQVLIGSEIAVAPEVLGTPASDEFYWHMLQGCRVVNEAGVDLGQVDHLLETGAQDVLVITSTEAERMIPFESHYILRVDAEAKIIYVAWEQDW